jgi:hypothetical protein
LESRLSEASGQALILFPWRGTPRPYPEPARSGYDASSAAVGVAVGDTISAPGSTIREIQNRRGIAHEVVNVKAPDGTQVLESEPESRLAKWDDGNKKASLSLAFFFVPIPRISSKLHCSTR